MGLVDTHVHLHAYPDHEALLARAALVGVTASLHRGVIAAIGLHPSVEFIAESTTRLAHRLMAWL